MENKTVKKRKRMSAEQKAKLKRIREQQAEYSNRSQKPVTLKFHKELDKDILEYFETQPSKLEVVRVALREYMTKSKT